jgi:hypothetical protein
VIRTELMQAVECGWVSLFAFNLVRYAKDLQCDYVAPPMVDFEKEGRRKGPAQLPKYPGYAPSFKTLQEI